MDFWKLTDCRIGIEQGGLEAPSLRLHRTRIFLEKRYSVGALQESSEWELQGTNSVIAILTTSRKMFKGICANVAIQMKILNS